MSRIQKIPLRKRLQNVSANQPDFLAAFELFLDDYFWSLAQMRNNPYFLEIFENNVKKYNDQQKYDCILAELPEIADTLPGTKGIEFLYESLVMPFT